MTIQVKKLEHNCFDFLNVVKGIEIPACVEEIQWSFYECKELRFIKVNADNKNYKDIDGVLYSRDGKTLIAYPNAHGDEYAIPSGVKEIAHFAFKDCSYLKKLIIPDSVKKIGANAFYGCTALESVTIPSSIPPKSIGKYSCEYRLKEPKIFYNGKQYASINDIAKNIQ